MSIIKRISVGLLIFAVLIIVLVLIVIFVPFSKTKAFVASEYKYDLEYFAELDSIPVMSQETEYTCPIVSMAIVKNYLGAETSEYGIRSDLGLLDHTTGLLPNEYLLYANSLFEPLSISVSLANPTSQAEILNIISESLENKLPVVIFYSSLDDWNKPHYNTHYAVVYGIDMKEKLIKISNPYGYLEEMTFTELYNGLDYSSYKAEPFMFRLARRIGMANNNNLFTFYNN